MEYKKDTIQQNSRIVEYAHTEKIFARAKFYAPYRRTTNDIRTLPFSRK
jgi:hypothetical protein